MIPKEQQRRVAHLDVQSTVVFSRSIDYWRLEGRGKDRWKSVDPPETALLIGKNDGLIINGDLNTPVSAPDGGVIHIAGDLNSRLETGGHHEVVIEGDVAAGATIQASGFFHAYIGGSLLGSVTARDSSRVWIDGDFAGVFSTGTPSTQLSIAGSFSGEVAPTVDAALLWLVVDGYASNDTVQALSMVGYTDFSASIGASDVASGLYPTGSNRRTKKSGGNCYRRWCVLRGPEK